MKQWLHSPLLQIAVILGGYAWLGHYLGVFAIVWSSPLFAALLARPLMALASTVRRLIREYVWRPVHGKHYVFRDVRVRVLEDDGRFRWVCLADVRRVVPSVAGDRALELTYPDLFRTMGKPAQSYLRDDALVLHLSKQGNLTSFKFRTWVERAVVSPGQKARSNLAIQDGVADPSKQT